MNITTVEGSIPVNMPERTIPIKATLRSDIHEGITITILPGAPMYALHEMIAAGELLEVAFVYRPSEKG